MNLTPQDFVAKWKRVTSRERQVYQEHFIDLCHLVGHQTPNESDPTGTRFAFEMGAGKTSGGQGWADVAKLGYFGWEYKGKDHDLDKAYAQLLLYRDALQNPPVLVVSDINKIIIRTNYTNLPTRTITLTLDDMLKPEALKALRAVFFNPEELKPAVTIAGVTEEAARHFSKLAGILRKYGESPQAIAHFLIRLLFCLFAEDIGLLPERLFPRLLDQTRRNAKDFAGVLGQLFGAMKDGGYFGSERILHFNGGLFDDDQVLELDGDAMDIIANIDALDWGQMEPSIFGTLFERGLDPAKRSQLGAHYTSKDDIMLIVEPVLMAPLRLEWQTLQAECREQAARAQGLPEKKRAQEIEKVGKKLRAFADRLTSIKVLDPACGSGNFLYVALRLLLDLQDEVISVSDELGAGRFFISVSPAQLHGIELNEYAHELAQVTIWIGYIQWLVSNGYGLPSEPILKKMDNIQHMDAILAFNAIGKPMEPEWPAADVIVGNPPFLGGSKLRNELGNEYVDAMFALYGDRLPVGDLVCYWFEKARAMIETEKVKRVGLLATQGIRGGANRKVLERIKETGDIFWAQSDRAWILNGAAVRVSMIGFDNGDEQYCELDGKPIETINSDLSSASDLTFAKPLEENIGLAFVGSQKIGSFDISAELAEKMLQDTGNPNGQSNRNVVKPSVNGSDIMGVSRNAWIIDFGVNMSVADAAQYEMPFEYIKKNVYPERMQNHREAYVKKWWQHGEARPGMRRALEKLSRFIVTSRVSKHCVFIWVSAPTLPDHKLCVIARSDDYFLGVLQSRLHEVWSLQTGARHGVGNDPVYNLGDSFETFPFPWPPSHEPTGDPRVQAIAQAAKELVEMRERWLNAAPSGASAPPPPNPKSGDLGEAAQGSEPKRTLTNLYNARPTWLALAHKKLDAAVFAAYGWPNDLSDEQILEKLLALNLERAGRQA